LESDVTDEHGRQFRQRQRRRFRVRARQRDDPIIRLWNYVSEPRE